MKIKINNLTIEVVKGDITKQPKVGAIVNAANAELKTGGGVAGAIHNAAGPGLEEETRPLAPIQPGKAVITSAHNLPNDYIIHCLGPVYGRDKPEEELLRNCYKNALYLAEKNNVKSIAFPLISSGAFGYPKKEAATAALDAVKQIATELNNVELVRFVLFNKIDLNLFKNQMK